MKCPYKFPLRSRKAMINYITKDRPTHSGLPAWKVKVYNFDESGKSGPESIQQRFDSEWAKDSASFYYRAFESALANAIGYDGKEWTSYPGNDQGEWQFFTAGRSGGWIVLESWRQHKGSDLLDSDSLAELPYEKLRLLYRGFVTADSDFTSAKACQNVNYAFNWIRAEWESEMLESEAEFNSALESSRPDMYQTATQGV